MGSQPWQSTCIQFKTLKKEIKQTCKVHMHKRQESLGEKDTKKPFVISSWYWHSEWLQSKNCILGFQSEEVEHVFFNVNLKLPYQCRHVHVFQKVPRCPKCVI